MLAFEHGNICINSSSVIGCLFNFIEFPNPLALVDNDGDDVDDDADDAAADAYVALD